MKKLNLLKKLVREDMLYVAAILDFTQKRGFPQGGFGWGFMGVLHGPTESNSVEKPLLTFLSIKKYLLPGLIVYDHRHILKNWEQFLQPLENKHTSSTLGVSWKKARPSLAKTN